ncbi:heat shock protein 70 family protein [Kipferlia bialata]|uniref:Heat shock protein 70 family protein n=1 Tax=Kipferlia bialata TaxID=797122 RepID=A0A391NST5_9EUKA|nr:heat shock protein 70 family protein [Kipferlia bialata]|eukprot:g13777.t1
MSGRKQDITVRSDGGLTESEIQGMVSEAEANRKKDEETLAMIELRNACESTVYSAVSTIEEHGDKVSDEARQALSDSLYTLQTLLAQPNEDLQLADVEMAKANLSAAIMAFGKAIYEGKGKK